MTWPQAGPGRPFASLQFAAWRGYLTRKERARIDQIEDMIKSKAALRHEGMAAAKYEYAAIRNRAVKRQRAP